MNHCLNKLCHCEIIGGNVRGLPPGVKQSLPVITLSEYDEQMNTFRWRTIRYAELGDSGLIAKTEYMGMDSDPESLKITVVEKTILIAPDGDQAK